MPSGYRKDGTPSGVIFKKGDQGFWKGKKRPEDTKEKISKANKGENSGRWKGDSVGYSALHAWVRKKLGKPKICSDCGTTDPTKKYDWANISGEYLRDVFDYKRLCAKCHRLFDHNSATKGAKHPHAKLTEKEVIEIRKLYVPRIYSFKKLAIKFHVERTTIRCIINRKSWKHI